MRTLTTQALQSETAIECTALQQRLQAALARWNAEADRADTCHIEAAAVKSELAGVTRNATATRQQLLASQAECTRFEA